MEVIFLELSVEGGMWWKGLSSKCDKLVSMGGGDRRRHVYGKDWYLTDLGFFPVR